MIFFGNKAKQINGPVLGGLECPHCGHEEFVSFGIMRYFHLYWIPTLVTSKIPGVECLHCKKTVVGEELPVELANSIGRKIFTKNKVIPMFSGSIILALLITSVFIAESTSSNTELSYGLNPQVGDIYTSNYRKILGPKSDVRFENYDSELKEGWSEFLEKNTTLKYGDLRVFEISEKNIYMQTSLVLTNKSSQVGKIERPAEEYEQELLVVKRTEIEKLLSQNAIVRIKRREIPD